MVPFGMAKCEWTAGRVYVMRRQDTTEKYLVESKLLSDWAVAKGRRASFCATPPPSSSSVCVCVSHRVKIDREEKRTMNENTGRTWKTNNNNKNEAKSHIRQSGKATRQKFSLRLFALLWISQANVSTYLSLQLVLRPKKRIFRKTKNFSTSKEASRAYTHTAARN